MHQDDSGIVEWFLIQERELKHGGVGPEASRLAATARRKLGTLGTLIENLRTTLELRDDENL